MEALTLLEWGFDAFLGLGLLWLAWQTLTCSELFKAIVLFIAFGLLMALAWVRLDAPDVALAEAAIGAGLTGALLLAAFAKLRLVTTIEEVRPANSEKIHIRFQHYWLPIVTLLLVTAALFYAILSLPPYAIGLSAEVATNLDTSGVINPVTAVLLNFRAYDTLLEMLVLLLALLGVWSLGDTALHREAKPDLILDTLARVLVPLLILVAAYLLWVGAHAPGGAFQAGAVLGAAGVLLLLAGWHPRTSLMAWPLRLMLVAGPAVFVVMAVLLYMIEGRLLAFPPEQAGMLILWLETAATASIGITLAVLFLGGRPRSHPQTGKEHT